MSICQGIAIQPEFLVWRELREGTLVIGMPEWSVTPLGIHLLMSSQRLDEKTSFLAGREDVTYTQSGLRAHFEDHADTIGDARII